MKRALIIMMDLNKQQFPIVVERIHAMEDVRTLANFLEEHSSAQVLTYSYVEEEFYRGKAPQETGHYDRVDQQLKTMYLDPEAGDMLNFSIPAPNDDLVDGDQEVTAETENAIKTLLLAITDRTILLSRGGGIIARFSML